MTIHWVYLLLAVALLWSPQPLGVALRRQMGDPRRELIAILNFWTMWQNWWDLIRGAAGALLLIHVAATADSKIQGSGMKVLALQGGVLMIAILIQLIRKGRKVHLVVPVAFITGITLVAPGFVEGAFACAVAWAFALGSKRPQYILPVMGVALGLAGFAMGLSLRLVMVCSLIFLPVLTSLLFQLRPTFVARTELV